MSDKRAVSDRPVTLAPDEMAQIRVSALTPDQAAARKCIADRTAMMSQPGFVAPASTHPAKKK